MKRRDSRYGNFIPQCGAFASVSAWFLFLLAKRDALKTQKCGRNETMREKVKAYWRIYMQLHWKAHNESVCSKLTSMCFILLTIRSCFSCPMLKEIYFNLSHCHVPWCCESWAFTFRTHLEPPVRLQRRDLRAIAFSTWCASTAPLFATYRFFSRRSQLKW